MKALEEIRNKLFWINDLFKGAPILSQYRDIQYMMHNWGNPDVLEKRDQYLSKILDYAVSNISYYRQYSGYSTLSDFPVLNKNIIRDNEDQFFNSRFDRSMLHRQATSGSTGAPFVVYQDPQKRKRATADTLFFSDMANYKVGARLYFSRVWESGTERSAFTKFKQNWVTHDSSNLSDQSIKDLLNDLENDNSTKNVLLFASTLSSIANYLEYHDIKPHTKIESFITVSESLDPTTKTIIQKRFCAPVVSRYSNQELGIMAQQPFDSDDFVINVASFYFELLDLEEDKPVACGCPGRIVVTDLFNHSMPLIRYDTGDVAILNENVENNSHLPTFKRIDGRRVDFIYDTKGNLLSPYVINSPMHVYMDIQQYQFIQDSSNHYTMLLNLKEGVQFKNESDMLSMLKTYLGNDAIIEVKYVNEIPVLKSGKRKQVINNYKPV